MPGKAVRHVSQDWNYLTVDGYKVWTEKDFTLEDLFGYVGVTITPDEVLPLNPKWEAWDEANGVSTGWIDAGTPKRLSPGLYTIRFTDVTNWKTPDPVSVLVKRANMEEITVKYLAQPKLTVNIGPDDAPEGARWRLTSGPDTNWKVSGAQVQVPPGTYTVEFNLQDVEGWNKPTDLTAGLDWDQEKVIGQDYAQHGTITGYISGLSSGRWQISALGTGWRSSGSSVSAPPGSYRVVFLNPPNDYVRPEPKDVTVSVGQSVSVTGNYVKMGQLQVFITGLPPDVLAKTYWHLGAGGNLSGETISIAPSRPRIYFPEIPGYIRPDAGTAISAPVSSGQLTVYTGRYRKIND